MRMSRSPSLAATLSFLLPGLGQLSLGAARRGVVQGLPAVALLLAVVLALIADARGFLLALLTPQLLVAILLVNLGLTIWHVASITDAWRLAERRRPARAARPRSPGRSAVLVTALLVATLGIHGALEAITYQVYATVTAVFVPSGPDGGWIPEPSFEPSAEPSRPPNTASPSPTTRPTATATPIPTPTPGPTPSPPPAWAADGRLNLLLIGSDAGPDRWSLRTDAIVVLSVDVASGRAALLSIPRNLVGVPLAPESAGAFPGGRFPGLLNALYVYAMGHPAFFPGGEGRGFRAISGAVQELVGVRLDGLVVVNLAGFVRLVDAIGGLWINPPERVVDSRYPLEDGTGHIAIDIRPGCQRLDGRLALAYARSRRQDSDYGRMRRQQAVLVALARQVDPIALLPRVPELLDIARGNLWMTIGQDQLGGLAALAGRVDTTSVRAVSFVPPRYPSHLDNAHLSQIRSAVRTIFDDGGRPAGTAVPTVTPAPCP